MNELEFYECDDCHEEALLIHRYSSTPVVFHFCDKHSLADLRRDLHRMKHGFDVGDFIGVELLPI